MRGTHRIVVQNKRIRYDFELRRNITVIQGDSATGKTTLVEMIREYYEEGAASGIRLECDKECVVLSGRDWKANLERMRDRIVFIDEGNEFILTDEFAAEVRNSDDYYVIVTRGGISSLPYSVEEIYGIRNSGKYGTLKQTYQEFFHLYNLQDHRMTIAPEVIITEDSNSGHQFFLTVSEQIGAACFTAGGKSNIFAELTRTIKNEGRRILVIADGAAFGAEMEKIIRLIQGEKEILLYLPESFEWLLLKSGVVEDGETREILKDPGQWIDSRKYFSWERFFTALLIRKTEGTYLQYTKRALNPAYLERKIRNKVLSEMEWMKTERE